MLKLKKFIIANFRSVKNSEWVEVEDTASLIRINPKFIEAHFEPSQDIIQEIGENIKRKNFK